MEVNLVSRSVFSRFSDSLWGALKMELAHCARSEESPFATDEGAMANRDKHLFKFHNWRKIASNGLVWLGLVAVTAVILKEQQQIARLGDAGYIGVFFLSFFGNATLMVPLPTAPMASIVGGGVFNPIAVGIIAAAGATLGELIGFLAGRNGQSLVWEREIYQRVRKWMQHQPVLRLFVMAIVPNPIFDIIGMAAGLLGVSLWKFLIATWAGKSVKYISFALIGAILHL